MLTRLKGTSNCSMGLPAYARQRGETANVKGPDSTFCARAAGTVRCACLRARRMHMARSTFRGCFRVSARNNP